MDKMYIRDLQLFANHGFFKEEKTLGQLFELTLEMDIDLKSAGRFDDLDKSVDYGLVCKKTRDIFTGKTYDLIETAASKVAEGLLVEYPEFKSVRVSLKKPWAPIMMNLDTVEISIERRWHRAFLSLGSNMGDKEANIRGAIAAIADMKECRLLRESTIINTKPWGKTDQEDFRNAAIEIMTYLEPYELLKVVNKIEKDFERVREVKWGPRTLDIDILLYDDLKMYDEELIIPHPYMHERDFVLKPMIEIAPFYIHPVYNMSMLELAKKIEL